MLDQHYNSTSAVIGKWTDIKTEGETLTAEPEFDTEDEAAAKIAGKVQRGYIKAASIGVTFDREKMKMAPDGVWELTACEMYEASIVAIPSNANALRLYAAETGELLSEDAVKLTLSALTNTTIPKNETMNKIVLSLTALTALCLTAQPEDSAILAAAIDKLATDYKAEKDAHTALKLQVANQAKAAAKTLCDEAVVAGKITAELHAQFLSIAESNLELATKVIGAMPGKTSLAAGTVVKGLATGIEVKTLEEFTKLSIEKQLAFKNENPDKYKALFAE